jgi:hypothetical protein
MTASDKVAARRGGRRAAFVIGLLAAIAVTALAAGAGGAALDRSGVRLAAGPPKEYTPASRPWAGGSRPCPSGFRGGGFLNGRCYAECASSHEQLQLYAPGGPIRGGRVIGFRCVPRRPTRLYYGLELRASYRHTESGTSRDTVIVSHEWHFRPNVEAVTLFRQCTILALDENGNELVPERLLERESLIPVPAAIPCKRQERAIRPSYPAVRVYEDVSFRTDGKIVGGGLFSSRSSGKLAETIWFENDQLRKAPCFNLGSEKTEGSGPRSEPAQVRTRDLSGRFRGLEILLPGRSTPGSATHTTSGVSCPPVPEGSDEHRYHADPSTPPIMPEMVDVTHALGTENALFFQPNLGDRFGAKRIEVTDVVEVEGVDNPNAKDVTRVKFTLILTRCARQSPPSKCRAVP